MALLTLYFQNCTSDFEDFCTDVRNSCPEYLTSVLCATKILFASQGGFTSKKSILALFFYFYLLLLFYNLCTIILQLWDWLPPSFYVLFIWPPPRDLSIARLFNLAAAERTQHCAVVYIARKVTFMVSRLHPLRPMDSCLSVRSFVR